MAAPAPSEGPITGINVTPLVDVVLVLLIIFMVTAKIIVSPALPVDLPKAKTSEEVQVILSLIVPKDGPLLCNGAPMTSESDLLERAREARAKDAKLRA